MFQTPSFHKQHMFFFHNTSFRFPSHTISKTPAQHLLSTQRQHMLCQQETHKNPRNLATPEHNTRKTELFAPDSCTWKRYFSLENTPLKNAFSDLSGECGFAGQLQILMIAHRIVSGLGNERQGNTENTTLCTRPREAQQGVGFQVLRECSECAPGLRNLCETGLNRYVTRRLASRERFASCIESQR